MALPRAGLRLWARRGRRGGRRSLGRARCAASRGGGRAIRAVQSASFARLRRAAGKDPGFGVVRLSAGGRRSLACVLLCPLGYVRRGAPHRHWAMRRALAGGQRVPTRGRRSLASVLLCPVGYAPRREPSRRLGAAPPRPCGPLCRPEVGVPLPACCSARWGTRREGSHPDGWGRRRRGAARRGAGPHRENWPEVGVPSGPRAFS